MIQINNRCISRKQFLQGLDVRVVGRFRCSPSVLTLTNSAALLLCCLWWWVMVATATSFTRRWNRSFLATKSVSQLTWTHPRRPDGADARPLEEQMDLLELTSTMTASWSRFNTPMRPWSVLRPSSLLALLQPSFRACSWSHGSA